MYTFTPTTEDDVKELVLTIRQKDAEEVRAMTRLPVAAAIKASVRASDEAWTFRTEEGVGCIFGVSRQSILDDVGCPWLMTTPIIEKHKKVFLICTRETVAYWLRRYSKLENYIDANYTQAIRWAKWAGFTVYPATPLGVYGHPFCRIEMRPE